MSLQKYKKIEDNRGYFIEDRDSEIFERSFQQSLYGDGENDIIKFTLYDVNENLLPQNEYGHTRYIHSSDFSEYFKKVKGTENQINNQPFEYEINVDKLIEEAGYKNGIFNVEIVLVNDRVGSNHKSNRLWIHEISPSRTEIRVLPLKVNDTTSQDIVDRSYKAFIDNEMFMDDVREVLPLFLDSINITNFEELLLNAYGTKFIRQLKNQYFKDGGFNLTMLRIIEDFKAAVQFTVDNKNSIVGDINFGKSLDRKFPISLNLPNIVESKLRESIEYHLPIISDREVVNQEYRRSKFDIVDQNLIRRLEYRDQGTTQPVIERKQISFADDIYRRKTETVRILEREDDDVEIIEVPEQLLPRTPAPPPTLPPIKPPTRGGNGDDLTRDEREDTGITDGDIINPDIR